MSDENLPQLPGDSPLTPEEARHPVHRLGQEFWTQPTEFLTDTSVQLIYANLAECIKAECIERGSDTLDIMLAERSVALYAHIRQRETTGSAFDNDRNRKETIQLWSTMTTQLKKIWVDQDKDKMGDLISRKVTAAMRAALEELPEQVAWDIQAKLRAELVNVGLG